MDRNEEFRKRLDKRLNKGGLLSKRGFDPTPYVDILMEKIDYEDYEDAEELKEFIDEVLQDPAFDFIFGSSSLLSVEQRTKTAFMLLKRIRAFHDFDPEPHAEGLMDIYKTPAFDQYLEIDEEDGQEYYDFEAYYAEYDFTKEQKEMIESAFDDQLREKTVVYKGERLSDTEIGSPKYAFWALAVLIIVVIIPPFFIPNLLQHFGWLPSDAGWLMKIGVGIISLIVLFFGFKKVLKFFVNRTLNKIKRQNAL